MTDPKNPDLPGAKPDKVAPGTGASARPPGDGTKAAVGNEAVPAKELTPEEQMALYEEDLKENDWGHQPC